MRELIEENNDRMLKEYVDLLGNVVQKSVISEEIIKMGYSYKKILKAAEQNRLDVLRARINWLFRQDFLPTNKIVCLDESSAKTNMTRRYGRSITNQRCYGHAPDGK